jgi:hypothetical protein
MSPRLMSISSSSRRVTDCGVNASSRSPSKVSIDLTRRALAAGQGDDLVARLHDAAHHLAGKPAVVQVRADHVLHGVAEVVQVAVLGDGHRLQVLEHGPPSYQGILLAPLDHVVALEARSPE